MSLTLSFNFTFEDLHSNHGIDQINQQFHLFLKEVNHELFAQYLVALAKQPSDKEQSQLLIELAPYIDDFIAHLFVIERDVNALINIHKPIALIAKAKRLFVQRRALKKYRTIDDIDITNIVEEIEDLLGSKVTELVLAKKMLEWLEENDLDKIDIASRYCAYASYCTEGQKRHQHGTLFKQPTKLDPHHLIHLQQNRNELHLGNDHLQPREGFALTDKGKNLQYAIDQTNYCIYCHNQTKDSCSKGLKDSEGNFKKSEFGVTLAGCPIEEKISEMNFVKHQGYSIGALAIIIIDNPMVAATGHRICNDCMKSCIYQKQDPVDIPQIESRVLKDVLNLPYGFEIYSLLTRWNPLNLRAVMPQEDSGYKILVAGLGPAGFTLSHYLLNSGHEVVAIDGLKIEPLPKICYGPIKRVETIYEKLDERVIAGFGGVTEYGITVRWNKNFLKIIRILLERRKNFSMIGGIRFNGNITYQQAFAAGFDHIALCLGAGKPNILNIENLLARGVRTASDFLMALQLTGAFKRDSIANLQIRLPIIVIGGGLTAIDAATEALTYYPVQVEKFMRRIEIIGIENLELTAEEQIIAEEFIVHAKALRNAYRKDSHKKSDIISLLKQWGGVKILYRKRLIDAPCYKLNHEEVESALATGISFVENVTPVKINLDHFSHVASIDMTHSSSAEMKINYPARTILIATGTSPNTVLSREAPDLFKLEGKYFRAIDENGNKVTPEPLAKTDKPYVLTSFTKDNKAISFFGDLHPSFSGNVVKAMSSAKAGYPIINNILQKLKPIISNNFATDIVSKLTATIYKINRLAPNIIEVIIRSPYAAQNFQPGQFYRLHNFETNAKKINNTRLAMEPMAMTGAWVDKDNGLISTIILELGGSSLLCQYLTEGEQIVLMGPTGTPTKITSNQRIMLIGGGLGNAVLFSIGQAFREQGSKVLYFAGYKKAIDRYKVDEIEKAANQIIWCCDEKKLETTRDNDQSFYGNIVDAIIDYAKNGETKLAEIDRIICIGSNQMMAAVNNIINDKLSNQCKPGVQTIASINSPMQCMLKEICAQCLQKHIDDDTGLETYVFSCLNQDQCMQKVDFEFLNQRLKQNSLQEKLTAKWVTHCLYSMQGDKNN